MVLPWIIAAAKKIVECCAVPIVEFIKTEVGHLINYSANLEKLREQAENLSDAADSVNGRIKEAENHRGEMAVDATVKTWKRRTTSLQEDADKIIAEEGKAEDKRCLMGLRFNLWACYQVSKSAQEVIDKAVQLQEEKFFFARVANTDYSECLGVTPIPNFEEFKSRDKVSQDIVAVLKDPSVNMVGVFGMGGVGKTTLVEKVAAQLQKDRTFDFVVKATVSDVPDLRRIQGEIADPLKIKLEAETVQGRALQLMERLDKRRKLLIVLDDIWEGIPLKDIGIPFGTRGAGRRDEKGGHFDSLAEGADDDTKTSSRSSTHDCKILMTSRSETVLYSKMGSPRNFPLQELDDVDAWNLFQKTLGSTPEDPSWRSIADQVVERCSGIPVLLDVVSRALKDKDLQTWMADLDKLKSFDMSDLVDNYYLKIELSYNHLKGEEIKSLFRLLGQMNPHYIPVSYLLYCTMGLGIFKRCTSVEQVRNGLHICLNDLKDYGLLHDVDKEGTGIRMHDVVHKFAAYVGSENHHIYNVSVADKLEEWPDEDVLKQFKAIAFNYCRLPPDELPASFNNPQIESFIMCKNESDPPIKIPDKFFGGMKGLKLLDLTSISLSPALPTSLGVLVKLKTLCLYSCELDDIAIIGELPMLQVLTIFNSTIVRLPKELGKLTRLKILDLDDCSSLKVIASDVLSKMTSLEELNMRKSFKYWEKEGYCSSSNSTIETILKNASLGELKNMPNLIYLSIHIPHVEMLPKELLLFENLKSFKILTGEAWDWDNDYGTSKTLKLKLVECAQLQYGGIKALMGRAEDVYLQQLNGFKSLCKLDSQGFPLMKHLNVQNGVQIQYIVISISSCVVFPKLETLVLQDLEKLEKIIYHGGDGQLLKSGSFENLSKIKVKRCNGLKDLFSSSLARGFLLRLKEIEVIDCQNMQTIVSTTGEIMGEMLFPHLNFIKLKSLPKLKTFCTADYIGCPSLQQLLIEDCPELKTFATNYASTDTTLFDGKVAFPNLEELTLQKNMDGLKTIWGNELHPNSFSKLKTLKIEDGSALLNVFPPSMLRTGLLNLQNLVISHCSSLEKVFDVQMLINERELHLVLTPTQLTSITIRELPKLKHVWNRDPHGLLSYQNLCSVNASLCPILKSLFPISVAFTLEQLEEIIIDRCEGMEEIVSKEEEDQEQSCDVAFLFPKVTHLRLWNLPALKKFYPRSYSSDWPQLSKLRVYGCDKFHIFGSKLEIIHDEDCKEEQRDIQVQRQHFLSFTKVIPNLEEVSLKSQDFDVICDQGFFTANKLKVLELNCFHDSSHVFPISFLQRFPNLEKLVVTCSHTKQLFPDELVADETNAKTLARISQLRLNLLPEMTHIWDSNSQLDVLLHDLGRLEVWSCPQLINLAPSTALLKNLTYLDVWDCNGLITLLASSTTKSLVQLKNMWIRNCSSLVEIVANDEDEARMEDIVYEKLEGLTLQSLASLTSFCSATCNFKFPALVSVMIAKCPKMKFFSQGGLNTPKLTKVWVKEEIVEEEEGRWLGELNSTVRQLYKEMDGFRGLEQLKLSEFPELKNIWLGKLPVALFSDLKLLEISECTFSSYAISSSMLLSWNNLEELQVTKCNSLEEIFDGSKELRNRNASENVGPFSELKKFYLADLSRLKHVWPENLEGILDFKNLSLLNICNCSSLRYVSTPSMILCLVQLQEIVVKNCASVEEIILTGEKEDGMGNNSVLIFPQLNILLLQSLPCLASFWSGNGVLECPCLGTITIVDCPKLETFTSTLVMQQELTTTEENGETHHTLTKPLFNDKVVFPNLEELKFVEMDGLKMIWQNELQPSSFLKLKTLKIEKANLLLTIFPPAMVKRVLNLENLTISNCESVQEVFDVQMLINESDKHSEVLPTQLRSVDISELPKLKHVWNRDSHGLLSYQNLCSVNVSVCQTLKSLFPVSVALTLQQLEELIIENCEGMEEIVSKEEEHQEQSCDVTFLFPKVTHLTLWELPALKKFYPGSYSSDWPKLSKLSVFGCDKFDIFGPKLEIIRDEACREEQRDIQLQRQPFLSFTKVIPDLEEVSLKSQDFDVICDQGFFTANKLKVLDLTCFHDSSHVFPISFLQRFPNLEKLVVTCSHTKTLFPDELVADETNAKTLARISQLNLDLLPEMTHIWDSNSQLDVLLHDLGRLEVWSCPQLINLAPSTALLKNLTYLDVWDCNGLITLLASSTTKSLVQLKNMWIRNCSSLVEIVANDEDEARMEDIVYEKLEGLTLQSLASLTSFCSATCNFKFPALVSVMIAKCPKMKFFSQGGLNTPKLTKVWVKEEIVEEEEGRWLGELNSTVRQLYKEMDGFRGLEQLKLSEFPELKNIWLGKLPVALFSDLKLLEISECTFSSYAISSSMLLSWNNLEELQVTKCNSLEEIFDGSEELRNRNASENVGPFSELKKFYLADLSRLKHVWPENLEGILEFKNLSLLNICNCSSLRYVFTPSMILCLVQLQEIVVKKCASVEEIILKGEKEDGMGNNSVLIFPQLNILLLQSLPCLASFWSGNGVLECPCLGTITIVDCPKLETFTSTLLMQQDLTTIEEIGETLHTLTKPLFNDKVAFPNLEELKFVEMNGLKMIWQNELHPSSFLKLKTLKIEKASTLLTIFPPTMVKRALNLENLTISNCESVQEVFDVQMLINESDMHGEVLPTQLRNVDISKLPKLKHVWNRDPHGLLSYQNLCSVNASLCSTLKSLFPVSIALTLQQLEELKIKRCKGMEEIISKEEEDQEQSCDATFLFPKVTHLRLRGLQALKRFYPGSYSSDWPKLSKLSVFGCDKFDIFGPKLEIIQDEACRKEQRDIQVQRQPFLSFTKVISNLEEVSLSSQHLDVICDQGLSTDNKLKILELQCFRDSSHVFPVSFLQRFPNLEKLVVACSNFKQLFPDELVADETNAKTLARISQLRLHILPKMTHIWDSNSQLDALLHDLGRLEVLRCHHLINLAPSTAFFKNLTYLDVRQCNGLITLLASSTAKSLVQLKEMRIEECNSLVVIVANDEDEACTEDIVYEKLKRLTLQSLASLTSFCSTTCNLKFPALVSLIMAGCPKMEFFSQGVLNTPKLSKVRVKKDDEGRWMGNLNSTTSQLYKEMNSS